MDGIHPVPSEVQNRFATRADEMVMGLKVGIQTHRLGRSAYLPQQTNVKNGSRVIIILAQDLLWGHPPKSSQPEMVSAIYSPGGIDHIAGGGRSFGSARGGKIHIHPRAIAWFLPFPGQKAGMTALDPFADTHLSPSGSKLRRSTAINASGTAWGALSAWQACLPSTGPACDSHSTCSQRT